MKPLKFIFNNSKKQLPLCALLCFFSVLNSLCYIGLALVSKALLDNKSEFYRNCFGLLFIVVFQIALHIAKSRISTVTAGTLDINFKKTVFCLVLGKNYAEIIKYHSGETVNRITADIEIIINFLVNSVPAFFGFVAKIIAGIIVIFCFSKTVGTAIIILGIFIAVLGSVIGPKYKKVHKSVQQQNGILKGYLQECIQNIAVIKTFFSSSSVTEHLNGILKNRYFAKLKKNSLDIIITSGLYFVFSAAYYSTLVWCAHFVALGTITVGTLISFLQIIAQIKAPLYNISGIIPQYFSAVASAERIIELSTLQPDKTEPNLNYNEIYKNTILIKAENINFSYGELSVIKDSSFEINKGGIVAVTGESGEGKTTLFKLLLGLYNIQSGKLYFELNNGNSLNINSTTRQMFSFVPQGNMILSGTIKENIMFGNSHATEQEFITACKTALVDDFVNGLPEKYNTYLLERGNGLSEGQIQRIAVARALLSNSPIVLLDESTSALDEQTERKLLENIVKNKSKTVFIISHKPAVLNYCTDILHIKNSNFTHKTVKKY